MSAVGVDITCHPNATLPSPLTIFTNSKCPGRATTGALWSARCCAQRIRCARLLQLLAWGRGRGFDPEFFVVPGCPIIKGRCVFWRSLPYCVGLTIPDPFFWLSLVVWPASDPFDSVCFLWPVLGCPRTSCAVLVLWLRVLKGLVKSDGSSGWGQEKKIKRHSDPSPEH